MRELNAVVSGFDRRNYRRIKQHILLFDRIYSNREGDDLDQQAVAELEFLRAQGVIVATDTIVPPNTPIVRFGKKTSPLDSVRLLDVIARGLAAEITRRERGVNVVCPLCEYPLPRGLEGAFNWNEAPGVSQEVMRIVVEKLPVPDASSSLEDILAFKADMRDSKWALQRLLRDLSAKKQTAPEIRDDIEWSLNEYTKSMTIHKLKAQTGFVEVYLIPAIEIVENLVKFNWSKIAQGALCVRKRKIELMEAEMKASGREVAFIYEAQKKFAR